MMLGQTTGGRFAAAGRRFPAAEGRIAAGDARVTPRLRTVQSTRGAWGVARYREKSMNKSNRKIRLSRESIRILTAGQLHGLAGAGPFTHSVFCPSDADCPWPSQGPCSNPCPQSEGLPCY